MIQLLKTFNDTQIPPSNQAPDWRANPIYWNYTWTHWMDFVVDDPKFN